jgi:hypothetical protein
MTSINVSDIKEHANVIAACGTKIGDVDHVQGQEIKLTKHGDGKHHLIPSSWVSDIRDGQIYLSKDSVEVTDKWTEVE